MLLMLLCSAACVCVSMIQILNHIRKNQSQPQLLQCFFENQDDYFIPLSLLVNPVSVRQKTRPSTSTEMKMIALWWGYP